MSGSGHAAASRSTTVTPPAAAAMAVTVRAERVRFDAAAGLYVGSPDHIGFLNERVRTGIVGVLMRHGQGPFVDYHPAAGLVPGACESAGRHAYLACTASAHSTCVHRSIDTSRPHHAEHPRHQPSRSGTCRCNSSAADPSARSTASRLAGSAFMVNCRLSAAADLAIPGLSRPRRQPNGRSLASPPWSQSQANRWWVVPRQAGSPVQHLPRYLLLQRG